jgi:gas vesicle protein
VENDNMVDQTWQTGGSNTGSSNKSDADKLKSIRDQAVAAGREIKDKAVDLAGSSGEKLKEQASELADAAKNVASQATDRLKEKVTEQRGAGAEYVGSLAETIRRAAREFDNDLPIAGKYIRKAAAQVENVSDSIRTGDINDLVSSAQTFARRQPTAFLGMAVLAGFAAVRFLKSSSDASSASSDAASANRQPGESNRGYGHDFTH